MRMEMRDIREEGEEEEEDNDGRQLLIKWGDLMIGKQGADGVEVESLVSGVWAKSSPLGDSKERLLHHFATALSSGRRGTRRRQVVSSDLQVSMNQVTPFLRFTHLTANQAILEAIQQGDTCVHVVDFDIMHGLQWPPLMQALAETATRLRITATGHPQDSLLLARTGDRLGRFALSLGLPFQFQPLILPHDLDLAGLVVPPVQGEALAVNCMLFLHRLLDEGDHVRLGSFLRAVRGLRPRVLTVGEREANLPDVFAEAVDHFGAIFESLEATLPGTSRERAAVESAWVSEEIEATVRGQLRARRYDWWDCALSATGFTHNPHSPFALSQANLLLRLHYPSEGYHLRLRNNSLFIAWHNRPLFSLSSWTTTPKP